MERDGLDETELVEQAKAGDLDAFERLVVLHQRAALQVAYVIAGPDAEDAAQEAFVKAFRALGRFRSGSPFRPWLPGSWPTRPATIAGVPHAGRA